jgi:trimeric autotransporter adhesin
MTEARRPRLPTSRPRCVAALAALLLACSDEPTRARDPQPTDPGLRPLAHLTGTNLTLPLHDSASTSFIAFEIRQGGTGSAGSFEIRNPNTVASALLGISAGQGAGLSASNSGKGWGARISTSNTANTRAALDVRSQSNPPLPLNGHNNPGFAAAAEFWTSNWDAVAPSVHIATLGVGDALHVSHLRTCTSTTTGCNLAVFQTEGANVARISRTGKAHFNGGMQLAGADVAEAFDVEGPAAGYEPGDVLVVSTRSDRRLEKSGEPYSTLVAGVYATKPGVLLTEKGIDEDLTGTVPLGVVGVLPTKVSAENGAIRRGDLLVSARTPGHAMRGTRRDRMLGATIGKALQEFTGPGTGVIKVLVNVK